jgi:hypothetical protein
MTFDLSIVSTKCEPDTISCPGNCKISATIRNSGTTSSPSDGIRIDIRKSVLQPTSYDIPSIGAGQEITIEVDIPIYQSDLDLFSEPGTNLPILFYLYYGDAMIDQSTNQIYRGQPSICINPLMIIGVGIVGGFIIYKFLKK